MLVGRHEMLKLLIKNNFHVNAAPIVGLCVYNIEQSSTASLANVCTISCCYL
jgi:hypothetical protein